MGLGGNKICTVITQRIYSGMQKDSVSKCIHTALYVIYHIILYELC